MTYEYQGDGALDYAPCRYGTSKLLFRGPKRTLDGRYIAMIGGTETFGKFIERPFPALIEDRIGRTVVNLGCVNAGVDTFANDQTVIDACSKAALTVIQVAGAQNMSNRFYAVHPRRNDRFLRASTLLRTIYREVDFTEFNFTRHLLTALREASADKFAMIEQELKETWVARMKALVSAIDTQVVLLWFADHAPEDCKTCTVRDPDPLFVDRDMLQQVMPFASALVEVVVSPKEIEAGYRTMVFPDPEAPFAHGMLGTVAHEKVAVALKPVLDALM